MAYENVGDRIKCKPSQLRHRKRDIVIRICLPTACVFLYTVPYSKSCLNVTWLQNKYCHTKISEDGISDEQPFSWVTVAKNPAKFSASVFHTSDRRITTVPS
jgi:hypothetical protein